MSARLDDPERQLTGRARAKRTSENAQRYGSYPSVITNISCSGPDNIADTRCTALERPLSAS
jgi:hypothetical protein